MRKINQILVRILILPLDFFLVIAAFYISFFIRYGTDIPAVNFEPFKKSFLGLGFIYILAFIFAGMFQKRFRSHWELCRKVFLGVVAGTLFSFVFLYVFRIKWASFPSSVFLLVIPVGSVLIAIANIVAFRMANLLKTNLLIVGRNQDEEILISRSRLEIHRVDNIKEVLNYEDIDEILICEQIYEEPQLNLLISLLLKLKINVVFSPSIYAEMLSENLMNETTVRFLATFLGRESDYQEFLIRSLDIVGSVFLLVVLSPLIVFIYTLIKVTSTGPILFKQIRVGQHGNDFVLYKFKTMVNEAEKHTGPVLASKNDPRVTKIGRFLRIARIDEIPQLFNVLCGQMSLVGPRPERPYFVKNHKHLRGLRLAVKPGLTGLAQVRNFYNLHPKHKIKYDYLYIQRRSLLLNLYILFKTIPVVVSKKGW